MRAFGFYLDGILGVHATLEPREEDNDDKSNPVPLFSAGHQSVHRKPINMSWKHCGRIAVCVVVILRAAGTTVLTVRTFLPTCSSSYDRKFLDRISSRVLLPLDACTRIQIE